MEIKHPGQPEGPRKEEGTPPQNGMMAGRLFRQSPMMAAFPPRRADSVAEKVSDLARKSLSTGRGIVRAERNSDDRSPNVVEAAATERVFMPIESSLLTSPRSLSPDLFEEGAAGARSETSSSTLFSPPPRSSHFMSPSGTSYLLPDLDSPIPEQSDVSRHSASVNVGPDLVNPHGKGANDRQISILSAKEFEARQKKIPKQLRPYPSEIQGALLVANKHKTIPTLKNVIRAEDIALEDLKAPIMIGKDKEGKEFVTICYESNGEVDFDVIYRFKDYDWSNTRQATSQIFSTTKRREENRALHEKILNVPQSPAFIRYGAPGELEKRLLLLVRGKEVPRLIEIPGSDDYKQPDPNPGPTVHLYNPKKGNRVMPWDDK